MNMAKSPVATYPVHDYLRMKLCALYENDCIFDKFECCWSPDDKYMMTGSYNNFFRIFDRDTNKDVTLEVNRDLIMSDRPLVPRIISAEGGHQRRRDEISVDCMDFQRRLLHLAWHPQQNILAIAATNNLFVLESRNLKISHNQCCANTVDYNATSSGASESINSMTTCSTSGYSSSLIVPSSSDDRMELD